MGKNKKAKIIFTLIVAIIIILILSIWYMAYGQTITKTIGSGVSATFNNVTGELTITSTSGIGTINHVTFMNFANQIGKNNIRTIIFTNRVYAGDTLSTESQQDGFFRGFTNLASINQISNFDTSKMVNMQNMFWGCESLTTLDLSNFNTSKVTNMADMFYNCISLTTLNLDNFDTSRVTNMQGMFLKCENLTNLDIRRFNTSNVTNMQSMFNGCKNLTDINVNQFNTSQVTNMSQMFSGCEKITNLDLRNFTTSRVTDMMGMFWKCSNLTNLDLSSFRTSNVTNINQMFFDCSKLEILDLSSFNTSKVTKMQQVFSGCNELTNLDLSNFNTSQVTNMYGMFSYCDKLTNLNLNNFDTSNVTNMHAMFSGCSALTNIQMNGWNTSKVTDMNDMFEGCTSLETIKARNWKVTNYTATNIFNKKVPTVTNIDVNGWDLLNVTTLENVFNGCTSLTSIIGLSTWNTINITNMSSMFNGCSALESIEGLSSLDTRNVINMSSMFNDCSALTSIELSTWNTRNVTSMNSMFKGCSKLTNLNLNNFNTSKVTTFESMFSDCNALANIQMNGWDTSKVTEINNIFKGCTALNSIQTRNWKVTNYTVNIFDRKIPTVKSIDVNSWDLSNVTTLENVFRGCSALTSVIGLNTWNTINITDMGYMFYGDKELTNIGSLSNWNTTNVVNMSDMFSGCNKLISVEGLSNWDISNVKNMDRMFMNCKAIKTVRMNGRGVKISTMDEMFLGCSNLTTVELDGFNTENLVKSGNVFAECTLLNTLELTNWNIKTDNMKNLIESIKQSNITNLNASNWNIEDNSIASLFEGCIKLTSIDVSNWNTTSVVNMSNTFKGCEKLEKIVGIQTWNTTKVTLMNGMFENCSSLTKLDLSNFNTSQVTDMTAMFSGCSELTTLDLSNFNTSKVIKSDNMFAGCTSLTSINLSNFDIYNMNIDLTDSNLLEEIYTPKRYSSNSTFILPANYYYNSNNSNDEKVYTGQVELTSSLHLKKGYAIFYNANGGTGEMEPQVKRPDRSVRIKQNLFTPPTYKYFDGWYTNANGTGTKYSEWNYYSENKTITLYAKWEPIKANYRILHYKQTAILDEYELVQVETNRGDVGTIATAEYYTDVYFKENTTHPETKVSGEIRIDGSLELKLYYDRRDYKLNLITNGGKINSGDLTFYQYGVMTMLPKDVTKDEYIFEGWYANSSFSGSRVTEVPVGTIGDKTYYAKWTPKTYKVTLEPNGGSIRDGNVTSYQYGEGATLPTDVKRRNYAFEGWYENIEGTGKRVTAITTTDTGDKTYYAKWKKGAYTVTLNTNGGIINSGDVTSYEYGEGAILPTDVTKPGYTFKGWYEDSELIGPTITVISKTETGEKTYYAKWEVTSYRIQLNTNGGVIIEGDVQTYTAGQEVMLPTKVIKEGYIFDGWYQNSSFAGEKVTKILNTDIGDKTFYAKWLSDEAVTYRVQHYIQTLNSGNYELYETKTYTGTVESKVIAQPEQYIGFTENTGHKGRIPEGIISADGSLMLKLYYDRNVYQINYELNGGTAKEELNTQYTYGQEIQLSSNIEKGDYKFGGWYETPELTGSMIVSIKPTDIGNKTFYAKWLSEGEAFYKVEHYIHTTGDDLLEYQLYEIKTYTGTINQIAIAQAQEYKGFIENTSYSERIPEGIIKADGSLILRLYYDRNSYRIIYELNGGTEKATLKKSYVYGEQVLLSNRVEKANCTFAGWYETSNFTGQPITSIEPGETGDKIFYAKWISAGESQYKVEHYIQTLNSELISYELYETKTYTGAIGSKVTAQPESYTGFTENTTYSARRAEGTVLANGRLVLKLYYDRNVYQIKYELNGGTQKGILNKKYTYGEETLISNRVEKQGYSFAGWYGTPDLKGTAITKIRAGETGDKTLYAKWIEYDEPFRISSDIYKIEDDVKYISRVSPNTTSEFFKSHIDTNGTMTVLNKQGKRITENELVGTGYKLQVEYKGVIYEYQIVVRGDIDGNGLITATDLSSLNQALINKIKLTGILERAADIDYDGLITVTDLSSMNQALIKKITL